MPDNPELDRHWAGDPGTLRTIPARAQRSHCAIHGGSQGAQAVQRGGTQRHRGADRGGAHVDGKGQPSSARGQRHAAQIDELVPTITKSKERLDEWEPHIKHYASSRLEAGSRLKLAKGMAALWGAIGAAVMFALPWVAGGGHFPKS